MLEVHHPCRRLKRVALAKHERPDGSPHLTNDHGHSDGDGDGNGRSDGNKGTPYLPSTSYLCECGQVGPVESYILCLMLAIVIATDTTQH